ncbi:MAG: hypothetical protein KKF02_09495, partial [Proteobacteria bacterium]|nr:hypothetical protein [Pseudomonadota bacterium]
MKLARIDALVFTPTRTLPHRGGGWFVTFCEFIRIRFSRDGVMPDLKMRVTAGWGRGATAGLILCLFIM